eukprot:CAMPEP_0184693524 /NCGR_PEP_ID=MMETSP0313-20130426/1718_1 /TAXON_ID=2792 /ORGANISM="Porphyridium aerugineum, Strain SAG 1380-2" /LENGTH=486 /DNA_ID=CAMNT_0027151615 /DNA_START=14 /DNA_END=1474 /DNA_ORIENTATION=+
MARALSHELVAAAVLILILAIHGEAQTPGPRFPIFNEGHPMRKFRHPYDTSDSTTPIKHFRLVGDALVTTKEAKDALVLTPALPNQQGLIVNDWRAAGTNDFDAMVDFEIIKGQNSSNSADGLAFWLLRDKPNQGPVYGIETSFSGLGIIIDTFSENNDRKHPYIYAWLNDGKVDWNTNGVVHGVELAPGCNVNRVRFDRPTRLFIQLMHNTLKVAYSVGHFYAWKDCFTIENVNMPFRSGGVFALSASTKSYYAEHVITNLAITVNSEEMNERTGARVDRKAAYSEDAGRLDHARKEYEKQQAEVKQQMDQAQKEAERMVENNQIGKDLSQLQDTIKKSMDEIVENLSGETAKRTKELTSLMSEILNKVVSSKREFYGISLFNRQLADLVSDLGSISDELQDEFDALHLRVSDIRELSNQLMRHNQDILGGLKSIRGGAERERASRSSAPIIVFAILTQVLIAAILMYYRNVQGSFFGPLGGRII